MKKNNMMRVASALLVAVLLTTCAISGTFAKYVTSGTASDFARVAKFGVTVEGKASADNNMFTKTYTTTDAWTGDDGVSVEATVDVVAPGTNGTLTAFDVAGTPEVDVAITYTNVDVELGDKWVDSNGDYYCPIVFTVVTNSATVTINGADKSDITTFENEVEAAIVAAAANYDANTDLSTIEDDLTVSWSWPFSTSEANDVKDTFLGDEAADDNAATINVSATCTVTQID